MATYPIRNRPWTRAEYDQLIAGGSFRPDERIELLGGQLVVREPQGSGTFDRELGKRAGLRSCDDLRHGRSRRQGRVGRPG